MQKEFPNRLINTPLGIISQGEFLQKIKWTEEDKTFFREIWKELPHLALEEVLKIKNKILVKNVPAAAIAKIYIKKHLSTIPQSVASSEVFPHRIIESPLGKISQGAFLKKVDWSLENKTFFREIWEKLPHLSIGEVMKIKKEMAKEQTPVKKAAKKYLQHQNIDEICKDSLWVSLDKTGAFQSVKPKKTIEPSLDILQSDILEIRTKKIWDSIDDTSVCTINKQDKQTQRRALSENLEFRVPLSEIPFVPKEEKEVLLNALCKSCHHSQKCPLAHAGQVQKCNHCFKAIKIPNPKFYLKTDHQSDVRGPFLMNKHPELIERGLLTPNMYISYNKTQWDKIEECNQSLVLLIAKYARSQNLYKYAISRVTNQKILAETIIKETTPKLRLSALEKIHKESAFQRVVEGVDQIKLVQIVLASENREVRKAWAEKLTLATAIHKIAFEEKNTQVRQKAIERIADRKILNQLLKDSEKDIERLAKRQLKILINAYDPDVVWHSLKKIAQKKPYLLLKYFSPLTLEKLLINGNPSKTSESIWSALQKIAKKDHKSLTQYMAPVVIKQMVEDSISL